VSALRASGQLDRSVAALAVHAEWARCDESAVDVEEARAAGALDRIYEDGVTVTGISPSRYHR
jgi:hypothetical protein